MTRPTPAQPIPGSGLLAAIGIALITFGMNLTIYSFTGNLASWWSVAGFLIGDLIFMVGLRWVLHYATDRDNHHD